MSPRRARGPTRRSPRAATTPARARHTVVLDRAHANQRRPLMSARLMARVGAASGIVYVGLIVLGGQIGPAAGIPAMNASPHTIGTYITHHPPTAAQWAGVYLEVLALLAFVVFVSYLWRVLRDAERGDGWLAGVALAGGLLSATLKLASLPAALAALYRADDGISPQVATALIDMNNIAFALTWATTALMLSATAGVALRTGVLPRWLGWSAIAIAIGLLASLPFAASTEPPTFLLALIWIVAASVVLIRRVETPTVALPRHERTHGNGAARRLSGAVP